MIETAKVKDMEQIAELQVTLHEQQITESFDDAELKQKILV